MSRGHGSLALAGCVGRHVCNTLCSTVCNTDARDAALVWRWRGAGVQSLMRLLAPRGRRAGIGSAPARWLVALQLGGRMIKTDGTRIELAGPAMRGRALWRHAGPGSAARDGRAGGTRAGRLRTSSVLALALQLGRRSIRHRS